MNYIKRNALYFTFAIAFLSLVISLYFSEVLKWAPCVLCWYQRVFIYPIVFVSVVGIIRKDLSVYTYILPLAVTGALFAFYHNLLTYGLVSEELIPCLNGVSCTTEYFSWFGFITIPFLSLISFVLIIVLMCLYRRQVKSEI
jgi:disulfide bond formation protein DsbB